MTSDNNAASNTLVAFDFDGTITTRDSLKEFVRYAAGTGAFVCAGIRVLPWLAGWALGKKTRGETKARFVQAALGHMHPEALQEAARQFAQMKLPQIVRAEMLGRVREHVKRGHTVLLVSASPSVYLKEWAKVHGVHAVISTELAYDGEHLQAVFATPNCWGPQKVVRLQQWLGKETFRLDYAYGDSRGDKEMLACAEHAWLRGRDTVLPPLR